MSKLEPIYLVSCLPYGFDSHEHLDDASENGNKYSSLAEARDVRRKEIKREADLGENADCWIFKVEVVE